jgi:hypothetical protein
MVSAAGHRGKPLICLLIRLRSSNEASTLPHGVIFSALSIEPTRNINEYEFQSGYIANHFPPEHGRNDPAPADGNSPLRQVLAAPGGDAGLLACSTQANSNVLAGFLAGEVRAAARSRYSVARTSRLYRLQRTRGRHGNLGIPESAHGPGRLSPGRPEINYDYPRHFSGIPAVSVFPRAAGRPEDGSGRRGDTGRRRGPGARARAAPRHDRHGPNPRPPAQIRSNLPPGATRSSTARYFILYRIKVT